MLRRQLLLNSTAGRLASPAGSLASPAHLRARRAERETAKASGAQRPSRHAGQRERESLRVPQIVLPVHLREPTPSICPTSIGLNCFFHRNGRIRGRS